MVLTILDFAYDVCVCVCVMQVVVTDDDDDDDNCILDSCMKLTSKHVLGFARRKL